jgi:hypothetical protein
VEGRVLHPRQLVYLLENELLKYNKLPDVHLMDRLFGVYSRLNTEPCLASTNLISLHVLFLRIVHEPFEKVCRF